MRSSAKLIAKALVLLGLLLASPVCAQQVATHAVPIGQGPGVVGFGAAAPGVAGQVLQSNGATSDPAFSSNLALPGNLGVGGSVTFSALGTQNCLGTTSGVVGAGTCGTAQTIATIAALKALSPAQAAAAGSVYVAGYTTAGDGGGGQFNWNATDSSTDNSCTIITPSSAPANGRWERTLGDPSVISVAQCGGFPSASDIGAYITLALAALPTTGGTVIIPGSATLYHMTTTVVSNNYTTIEGQTSGLGAGAQTATSIIWSGSNTQGRIWDMRNTNGATIQNLDFNLPDAFGQIAFDISAASLGQVSSFATLRNMTIAANSASAGSAYCVWATRAIAWLIENVNFSNCSVGVQGDQDTGTMQSTTGTIRKSHFVGTVNYPLQCGGNGWNIDDDIFEPRRSGVLSIFADCANMTWSGMYFTHIWAGDTTVDGGEGFSLGASGAVGHNFSLKDSLVAGHSTTSNYGVNIASGGSVTGVVLDNNTVEDLTEFLASGVAVTGAITSNTGQSVTYCKGGGGSFTGMLIGGNTGFVNAC